MTESSIADEAAQDTSGGSGDSGAECNNTEKINATASSPNYSYFQILQRLQTTALSSQDPALVEQNESTTTTKTNDQWDLSSDAQLATLLHEFTNHIVSRTHHVSHDVRALQSSVNNVGVNVALVQTEFMKRSSNIFMEQVVGDDDDESSSSSDDESDEKGEENVEETKSKVQKQEEDDDDGDSDNSSADIARLELEEQSAISDGMKALNLFFDVNRRKPPPQHGSDSESGNNGGGGEQSMLSMNAEEDMIGDNCYYYQAAEDDGFNQRPLPFIIGSREFMEASSSSTG